MQTSVNNLHLEEEYFLATNPQYVQSAMVQAAVDPSAIEDEYLCATNPERRRSSPLDQFACAPWSQSEAGHINLKSPTTLTRAQRFAALPPLQTSFGDEIYALDCSSRSSFATNYHDCHSENHFNTNSSYYSCSSGSNYAAEPCDGDSSPDFYDEDDTDINYPPMSYIHSSESQTPDNDSLSPSAESDSPRSQTSTTHSLASSPAPDLSYFFPNGDEPLEDPLWLEYIYIVQLDRAVTEAEHLLNAPGFFIIGELPNSDHKTGLQKFRLEMGIAKMDLNFKRDIVEHATEYHWDSLAAHTWAQDLAEFNYHMKLRDYNEAVVAAKRRIMPVDPLCPCECGDWVIPGKDICHACYDECMRLWYPHFFT